MLTEGNLRELLETTSQHMVLSVYLNTEPAEGNADAYKLRMRNLLKEVNLPQDVLAVEQYVTTQHGWSGRGIAVFSCAAENFFRAYPLAVPVNNLVHVGDRPLVKPLMDLMDSFGGYGVVLADKQGARLFYFNLGELREQEGVVGESVKHLKSGGASSVVGRTGGEARRTQHMDETIDRNMKEVAEFATHFFEENHVRRILIGGTDENVASLRGMLSKSWQSLVMGTFAMPMTATHVEVFNRTMQIAKDSEHQRELRLVDTLISEAAKGKNAVIGIEKTLEAVNQDRVSQLVVTTGFRSGGSQCQACGRLTVLDGEKCPACEGELTSAGVDVIDLAIHTVMHHGGEVEIVHEIPALQKEGSMGAMLRY